MQEYYFIRHSKKAEENIKYEVENVLIEIMETHMVKDCARVGQIR